MLTVEHSCNLQEMFLGRLTIEESHAAMERLVRYVMIKAVFLSAVVDTPDPAELAMWLAWWAAVKRHPYMLSDISCTMLGQGQPSCVLTCACTAFLLAML